VHEFLNDGFQLPDCLELNQTVDAYPLEGVGLEEQFVDHGGDEGLDRGSALVHAEGLALHQTLNLDLSEEGVQDVFVARVDVPLQQLHQPELQFIYVQLFHQVEH